MLIGRGGHVRADRQQEMQVIGDNHEIVQLELPGRHTGTKRLDQQGEQIASLAGPVVAKNVRDYLWARSG